MKPLPTSVGYAGWTEHWHFGLHVERDLSGRSQTDLVFLAVVGHLPSATQSEYLSELTVAATATDPRIWPLKLARVGSSYGRAMVGLVAAMLSIDHSIVGRWAVGPAANELCMLQAAGALEASDARLAQLLRSLLSRTPRPAGFGVAFRPEDERLGHIMRYVEKAGRPKDGVFWRLLERINTVTGAHGLARPNIVLGAAAMALDLEIPQVTIAPLICFLGLNNYIANAVEGAAQAPEVLQCLPQTAICYVGPAERPTPRALELSAQEPNTAKNTPDKS